MHSAAAAKAEEEQKELEYTLYDDPAMTIYDIYKIYGLPSKSEVSDDPTCQKELYYDFTPFNSKDPVLRSLGSG